jgi:ribonuclease VapC
MLAFLGGEPAGREVRQLLRQARQGRVLALFSIINFGEALYIVEREQGRQAAERAVGIVDQLALRIVPADRSLVFDAAHVKARYSISYADAFSVAVAKRFGGYVLTGDPEFEVVASEVTVRWLHDGRR